METYAEKIYIPDDLLGWWGGLDERPRCIKCKKVAFESEELAQHSANKATERGTKMGAYQCKQGLWHTFRIKN